MGGALNYPTSSPTMGRVRPPTGPLADPNGFSGPVGPSDIPLSGPPALNMPAGPSIFDQSAQAYGGGLGAMFGAMQGGPAYDQAYNALSDFGYRDPYGQFAADQLLDNQLDPRVAQGANMLGPSPYGGMFNQAAGMIGRRSGSNLMGAAVNNFAGDQGSGMVRQGAQGLYGNPMDPFTQMGAQGIANTNMQQALAQQGFAQSGAAGAVPRTMNQFLNPYQEQVIDRTLSRIEDIEQQDLNQVKAQAAQASAYGGARQGLVESEVRENAARQMGDTAAQLSQQGFDTAAQLGLNRISQQQQAAAGLANIGAQRQQGLQALMGAGLSREGMGTQRASALANLGLARGGQQIQRAAGQGSLGVNIRNATANQGALMGQLASTRAGLQQNAGQALANIGLSASGLGQAGQQAAMNYGLANQQQLLNQANMLGNLGLNQQQMQLAGGQGLMGGATTGFNLGQGSLGLQQQAGAAQQGMQQGILNQATGQFDQYVNYPQMALATALAGVQGNPMQGATTTTTTQPGPGLFDFLSLGAGLGAAWLGNPAAFA